MAEGAVPAQGRVLHVGCGTKHKAHLPGPLSGAGWEETRYDIDPGVKPDIVGDITDLSAIEDGAYDALFSSHNIEHLFAHQVPVALAEFARVLRPGRGIAVITCPDLQSIGQAIAEGRVFEALYTSPAGPIAPIDILYGHRASIARGNHFMAHRTGFTGQALVDALRRAGFAASTGLRHRRSHALWALGLHWTPTETEAAALRRSYFPASG